MELGRRLADLHEDDARAVAASRLANDREGAVCNRAVEGEDHTLHGVPR
jgi:hypothetical protein